MSRRYQDISRWKCCCCFDFKTGVLILAVLALIGSIYSFVYEGVIPLVNTDRHFIILMSFNVFKCVNAVVFFVASIMVIHGVCAEKSMFLRLFLLAQFTEIVIGFTKAVCLILSSGTAEIAVGTIIGATLGLCLGSYFLYVVFAYHQHLLYREYEQLFAPRAHVTGGVPMTA